MKRQQFILKLRSGELALGVRTLVMGVLNVTPDSFSDGGKFYSAENAVEHALRMQKEGAHILDVGAESTRPGSSEISVEEELRRLLPVLTALRGALQIPISVDTRKSAVAEAALDAGAQIINDISGLRHDPQMSLVASRHGIPIVLMHMRGEPATMQQKPFAHDVLSDVQNGLRESVRLACEAGVAVSQIILDPGIGFGKSWAQNYELLQQLPVLAELGCPLLVGTSRKGFISATLRNETSGDPLSDRRFGTAASVAASILYGAHIVRVHDIAEMAQVARVADCVLNPQLAPEN